MCQKQGLLGLLLDQPNPSHTDSKYATFLDPARVDLYVLQVLDIYNHRK